MTPTPTPLELEDRRRVLRHLLALRAAGLNIDAIAARAGVSPKKVSRITSGVTLRVQPELRDRLLAVDLGCRGKRRHPDAESAIAAAIRLSRGFRPLRVYECPDCHRWHLTKSPARPAVGAMA